MSDTRLDTSERINKALAVGGAPLKRTLQHRPRRELFAFLLERGGEQATTEQELAEAFDLGPRLIEYHLRVLHNAELIANVDDEQPVRASPRYVAVASL